MRPQFPCFVHQAYTRCHELGQGSPIGLCGAVNTGLTGPSQINQFHWHLVDSQSFPLQIPGFTDLSAKGAYEPSMIYTPKDVKEIVDYAGAVRFDFIRPTQLILKFGRS